jgi:hypothetical protein
MKGGAVDLKDKRTRARELAQALDGGWLDGDPQEGQPFMVQLEQVGHQQRVVITGPWVEEGQLWPV